MSARRPASVAGQAAVRPHRPRSPAAARAAKRCYGTAPPGLDLQDLTGKLVVLEGQDSSGRSTHVGRLAQWLEVEGHAVVQVGLRGSELVAPELETAREGNTLSPRTMSLFYATDFYDQLENKIVPALRSGAIVLADRYIFTLMARDLVRGAEPDWVENLYSKAIVPDHLFFLQATTATLLERRLADHPDLDYWESGMDLGISRDWHASFLSYQRHMRDEFLDLGRRFGFQLINANRSANAVQRELKARLQPLLAKKAPSGGSAQPARRAAKRASGATKRTSSATKAARKPSSVAKGGRRR
jgi:dTMP kinase